MLSCHFTDFSAYVLLKERLYYICILDVSLSKLSVLPIIIHHTSICIERAEFDWFDQLFLMPKDTHTGLLIIQAEQMNGLTNEELIMNISLDI